MRRDELQEARREHPFEPFRLHLTNGMVYEIRHPEMALLTRHGIHVVELTKAGKPTDKVVKCDLIHVVSLEPAVGRNGNQWSATATPPLRSRYAEFDPLIRDALDRGIVLYERGD